MKRPQSSDTRAFSATISHREEALGCFAMSFSMMFLLVAMIYIAALAPTQCNGIHPTWARSLRSHPMRVENSHYNLLRDAPGLYANYDFPSSGQHVDDTSIDMEVDHTWIEIPKASTTNGNAVFASSQYWYEAYDQPCPNKSDHGMSCNSAGYMGTQVARNGNTESRTFIFSCWDADSAHKVGWTTSATCSRFGGEGTGSHCLLHYPIAEGVTYRFRVFYDGKNASGAFWSGMVENMHTHEKSLVGTLYYPHLPNRIGFGNFQIHSDDFLEYFGGGDCDEAATTAVGITGPFFNGRTRMPQQAYPVYSPPPSCNRSVVHGCVAGVGCGQPHVLLSGGKGVVRNTTNKQPLWNGASMLRESDCTNFVDKSGCRANSDFANIALAGNLNLTAQVAVCEALCCQHPECDAWAVREKYEEGWAHNCSANGGLNCCLLKKIGWSMDASIPGCVSGGKSAAPPPPPPPPPAPPLPRGGGACTDDWSCSLGGECSGGKCVCDAAYTGSHCDVLRVRRAKVNNGIQINSTANHTWGGHALKDPASGKWVGFFSYMAGHCGLSSWSSQSMIISAVADAPDGPYNERMVPVIPPWSHNAMISKHPNGSYMLFHIGDGTPKGNYKPCSPNPDPFYPFPPNDPKPLGAATTHISESLYGPWRAAPGVPALNNPCPFFFPNGTTLLFDRTDVKWAPSVDYAGQWQSKTSVAVNGTMHPEDPGVWRDQRGNFHMLFNANSGHSHCPAGVPCGGHAWSLNGLDWSAPTVPAFGTIVHYQDNTTVDWDYVERPQIAQSDDDTPLTLFLGQSYKESHTLAIMFCQSGDSDADCVTTIQ